MGIAAGFWCQDVGSADGCCPRVGSRAAGFQGRFAAAGLRRWMPGAEAAEAGFQCGGTGSMAVDFLRLQEVRGRTC